MFRLNEEKVFVDYIDDQMVALIIETGSYYTFNGPATAVIKDLAAGFSISAVSAAFQTSSGNDFHQEELDTFIQRALTAGILEETDGEGNSRDDTMASRNAALPAEGTLFEMEGFDDVASYFMIDPIHEVNPEMGWPYAKEDEE